MKILIRTVFLSKLYKSHKYKPSDHIVPVCRLMNGKLYLTNEARTNKMYV